MTASATSTKARIVAVAGVLALPISAVGCGGGGDSTAISADGSSTVGPLVTKAAEDFREQDDSIDITVGISGTGGGFERFCRGETDLSNASRPIEDDEKKTCEQNDVEFVELQVANDALTVVVNKENDWATCLSVAELKQIWEPGSKLTNWGQAKAGFPDVPLKLFGPGTDSGTFDYFTDVIVGEEGASRSDYSASEDDNVLVQGVVGEKGGLGYFGFSYFDENREKLNAVAIDGGDGCVEPSAENAQSGEYEPLARPLYTYVKTSALGRSEVKDFLTFLLDNERSIAEAARFVPLNDEQLAKTKSDLEEAAS